MGYDLSGKQGSFRFNVFGWRHVLKLAEMYGWKPKGTKLNRGYILMRCEENEEKTDEIMNNWDGNYFNNSYQRVSAKDAINLSIALEKALPDIPDKPVHEEMPNYHKITEGGAFDLSAPEEKIEEMVSAAMRGEDSTNKSPLEFFSGYRQKVIDFIEYCKSGRFAIG